MGEEVLKGTVARLKSAGDVVATRVYVEEIAGLTASRAPANEKTQAEGSTRYLFNMQLGRLERAKSDVEATANIARKEAGDRDLVRARHGEAYVALRDGVVGLRATVTGRFDPSVVSAFGFQGPTPEDHEALVQTGKLALERLRGFRAPDGRYFDNAGWIAEIEPAVEALSETIEQTDEELREWQRAVSDRMAAVERYDAVFKEVTTFLVGLFTAAGREDLADKVRPSTRRPGQTEANAPNIGAAVEDQEMESTGSV